VARGGDALLQLGAADHPAHRAGEEARAGVAAAAGGVLGGAVEQLPALRAEGAEDLVEPGDVDGSLGEVGGGERGALAHLGGPGLLHLRHLPGAIVLGVRLDPPDGALQPRPLQGVRDVPAHCGA
jgi:hypothetical protein